MVLFRQDRCSFCNTPQLASWEEGSQHHRLVSCQHCLSTGFHFSPGCWGHSSQRPHPYKLISVLYNVQQQSGKPCTPGIQCGVSHGWVSSWLQPQFYQVTLRNNNLVISDLSEDLNNTVCILKNHLAWLQKVAIIFNYQGKEQCYGYCCWYCQYWSYFHY